LEWFALLAVIERLIRSRITHSATSVEIIQGPLYKLPRKIHQSLMYPLLG
jgi:hypothetical protein